MKKVLDFGRAITEFDGRAIKEQRIDGDGEGAKMVAVELKLKDAVLGYIRRADKMGLSSEEQSVAFILGFIIAKAEGRETLTTAQYDVIKKLADRGETTEPNGEKKPLYGFVMRQQTKKMVGEAENVEEKPAEPLAKPEK